MKKTIFTLLILALTVIVSTESCGPKKKVHRSGGKRAGGKMY